MGGPPDSEEGRYKLHDLARLFAESCLGPDELADTQQKHAKYYSKVLSQADKLYKKGEINILGALELFDREWVNIKVGQAWVKNVIRSSRKLNKSDSKFVMQLARSYAGDGVYVLDLRLHPRDKIGWLETGLTAARVLKDRQAEGAYLGNLGNAHAVLGDTVNAIDFYEQAVSIAREIGDLHGESNGLFNMSLTWYKLGQREKAIDLAKSALVILEQIKSPNAEKVRQLLEKWQI